MDERFLWSRRMDERFRNAKKESLGTRPVTIPPTTRSIVSRHLVGDTREPSDVLSGVLLSHGLRRSTIGAGGLNYRVRNGIGCTPSAITTEHIRRLYVGIYSVLNATLGCGCTLNAA